MMTTEERLEFHIEGWKKNIDIAVNLAEEFSTVKKFTAGVKRMTLQDVAENLGKIYGMLSYAESCGTITMRDYNNMSAEVFKYAHNARERIDALRVNN